MLIDISLKTIFLSVLFCIPASAQESIVWQPLDEGLQGDQVDFLWRSPTGTFFAGGEKSGLFSSTELMAPWQPTSFTEGYVSEMATDPSGRIYAATSVGLFFTEDEGLTWQRTSISHSVYAISFTKEGVGFAGTLEGVYRGMAGEYEWLQIGHWEGKYNNCTSVSSETLSIPICGLTTLEEGTVVVGVKGETFQWKEGIAWECFPGPERCYSFHTLGLSPYPITRLQRVEDGIFIAAGCSVYRHDIPSNSLGSAVGSPYVFDIASSAAAIFLAVTGARGASCYVNGGIFRLSKDLASLTRYGVESSGAMALVVDELEQWVCIGAGNGVSCSFDEGTTWLPWKEGLTNAEVPTIFITRDHKVLAGTFGGIQLPNPDFSTRWVAMNIHESEGCVISPIAFAQLESGSLFANFGKYYKSNDEGITWGALEPQFLSAQVSQKQDTSQLSHDINLCGSYSYHVYGASSCPYIFSSQSGMTTVGNRVYTAARDVYVTEDEFSTLKKLPLTPLGNTRYSGVVTAVSLAGTLLTGTRIGLLRMPREDSTWAWSGLEDMIISDIATLPPNIVIALTNQGIYRSTDDGITWDIPFKEGSCFNSIATYRDSLVVIDGALLSRDLGLTWQSIENPLPGQVLSMGFDDSGVLYAGTLGWGIYRSAQPIPIDLKDTSITQLSTIQLYPNPATNQVTLVMEGATPGKLSVDLFDILGRHQSQVYGEIQINSNVQLDIQLPHMPSGRYIIRVLSEKGFSYHPLTIL